MTVFPRLLLITLATLAAHSALAQTTTDNERLKISAIEALMAAPSDKALPILIKVMKSNNSATVKSRALFVLGQIDAPQAQEILLDLAKTGDGELQASAIRTIGISGNTQAIAQLGNIYKTADRSVKEHILHAYLIADDADALFNAAVDSEDPKLFDTVVTHLGAMGATEQLTRLRARTGTSQSLIHAYAIAGDTESLIAIAKDSNNSEEQIHAIHGLGIAGGGETTASALVDIFRSTDKRKIREAAMHGMMVGGYEDSLLTLFKNSTDQSEKSQLLQQLVIMDSDAALQAIDDALSEQSE